MSDPSSCCQPKTVSETRDTACYPAPNASLAPEEATAKTACCPPQSLRERPGYRLWPFVSGWMNTVAGEIPQVRTDLAWGDRVGRWQMRWGLGRMRYRIAPGLYAVGCPDPQAPVLVTANYKMSFDALRRELKGRHLWILVLETQGINVWCAAGKGTFGTDELVRRIRATNLERLVSHRRLILPQLGAVGVAAHEVRKQSGFQVIYGPVRAADLAALLDGGENAVTADMRRVAFPLGERLALTPVELVSMGKITLWAVLILVVLGGIGPGIFSFTAAFNRGTTAVAVFLAGVFGGAVLTPLLLPWLPWRAFSAKGALVGAGLALVILIASSGTGLLNTLALILSLAAVSSYCAMNFTGSTTFTSPSGVEKEMRRAIPFQAGALFLAGILWLGSAF